MGRKRDLASFPFRMAAMALLVEKNAAKALRSTGIVLLSSVVPGTPVDEGRARGNWLVGVNAPVRREEEPRDRQGSSAISEGSGVMAGARADDTIYISNNLAYIVPLNESHAWAGFVERAIAAANKAVKRANLTSKSGE